MHHGGTVAAGPYLPAAGGCRRVSPSRGNHHPTALSPHLALIPGLRSTPPPQQRQGERASGGKAQAISWTAAMGANGASGSGGNGQRDSDASQRGSKRSNSDREAGEIEAAPQAAKKRNSVAAFLREKLSGGRAGGGASRAAADDDIAEPKRVLKSQLADKSRSVNWRGAWLSAIAACLESLIASEICMETKPYGIDISVLQGCSRGGEASQKEARQGGRDHRGEEIAVRCAITVQAGQPRMDPAVAKLRHGAPRWLLVF